MVKILTAESGFCDDCRLPQRYKGNKLAELIEIRDYMNTGNSDSGQVDQLWTGLTLVEQMYVSRCARNAKNGQCPTAEVVEIRLVD